jgi:D-alanyl-D-alanine carboxypeptidase/D-alanyl-D-alanine-endopeptidase (penicillin-binding protein 4)
VPRDQPLRLTLCGLALLLVAAATPAKSLRHALVPAVERARRAVPRLGVSVVEVETGKEVYGYHAARPLIPASNTKLLTTAAALTALGPGFQFETAVLIRGEIEDGTLHGDLAVVGDGDPNFSGRLHAGDSLALFKQWASRLRQAGIRHIGGDLLLIDGLFDRQMVHPSWPRDQLDRWYEAPIAALSFNDNCVLVRMRPGAVGAPVRVDLLPDVDAMSLVNRSRTVSGRRDRLILGRGGEADVLELTGTISRHNGGWERWITVRDPEAYFGAALREAFSRQGLVIAGRTRRLRHLSPGQWRQALIQRSDLLTTIDITNKRSQNFYAESILKRLGARVCGEGSWPSGVRAVHEILASLGVPGGYHQVDGSGMSRENRVAPHHFATLLALMARHRYGNEFLRSLPYGGEKDLPWEDRLSKPPYAGNVFAKTGSLRAVSALSGYAKSNSGTLYAFSILMNGVRSQAHAHALQDAIVRALVDAG